MIRIILFLFFCLSLTSGQDDKNEEISELTFCTCDLKVGSCDVNCCCDQECTEEDRGAFSSCTDKVLSEDSKHCVQPSTIIFNNSRQRAELDSGGLLCIYYDNYKERNFYKIPEEVTTEEQFLSTKDSLTDVETFEAPAPKPLNHTYNITYKVGDAIFAVNAKGVLSELSLPRPLLTDFCAEPSPLGFMLNSDYECFVATNLAESCEILNQLSVLQYYKDISVLKRPEFLTNLIKELGSLDAALSSLTADASVPVIAHKTYFNVDTEKEVTVPDNQDLPAAKWDAADKKCENVVYQVDYLLTVNSTEGFVSVTAKFALGSATAAENSATIFKQKFTTTFLWDQENPDEIFRRSGNPGYQIGQPVMAGVLIENKTVEGRTKPAYAIQLNRDPNSWLTIIGSNDCSSNQRTPVLFGYNMQSGCLIEISNKITEAECTVLRNQVLAALTGPNRNRVAAYANASVELAGDWVPILFQDKPPSSPSQGGGTSSQGTCSNMFLGLDIEIVYANTGAFHEPQAKIIGVLYKYRRAETIQFQCFGPYCQEGAEDLRQKVPVISTVTFFDLTQPAEPAVAAVPTFDARFPNDFFYPFTGSAQSRLFLDNCAFLALLMCFTLIAQHFGFC